MGRGKATLDLSVALHPTIPTLLILHWEVSIAVETSNIQIMVSDIHRRVPPSNDTATFVPHFEVVLPGNVFEYMLAWASGARDRPDCLCLSE